MFMEFTDAELDMLSGSGFNPGFMVDIQETDQVAIPPVTRTDFNGNTNPVLVIEVLRIVPIDGSYVDENDVYQPNRVINFIGTDLDGRRRHYAYGSTYPCYYKRNNAS